MRFYRSENREIEGLTPIGSGPRVNRGFGATMYLMWQSNISGAIPVPIGSVNWSFSGQTTQSNGTWTTPTGSGFAEFAAASNINSFPQWTGLAITADHNCQVEQ